MRTVVLVHLPQASWVSFLFWANVGTHIPALWSFWDKDTVGKISWEYLLNFFFSRNMGRSFWFFWKWTSKARITSLSFLQAAAQSQWVCLNRLLDGLQSLSPPKLRFCGTVYTSIHFWANPFWCHGFPHGYRNLIINFRENKPCFDWRTHTWVFGEKTYPSQKTNLYQWYAHIFPHSCG